MEKILKNNIFSTDIADENGFIRLVNYPKYRKVLDKLYDLPDWVPLPEKEPKYPWKDNGEYYRSFVNVYVERLFKSCSGKWIVFSLTEYNQAINDDDKPFNEKRYINWYSKEIMYISKISIASSYSGRIIIIYYVDMFGELQQKTVKVYDVGKIAFRLCTDDEVKVFGKFIQLNPAPYLERFIIKDEYKHDYELYKKDAKKYGYPIWDKKLIDTVALYTLIDKDGYVSGGKSRDIIYVNL